MKNKLVRFLAYCLSRLDPITHQSVKLTDTKFETELVGYIPNDGEWHHYAFTIEAHIKVDSDDQNWSDLSVWVDGKQKEHYNLM